MAFTIRKVTSQDLAKIVELNGEIQRQHVTAYPDDFLSPTNPRDVNDFFEGILGDETHVVFLVTKGIEIAGYLWFQIQQAHPNPFKKARDQLLVHHILVSSQYQRQGAAKLLLEHVQAFAQSGCIGEIVLDSW
jgi:ribosomal protein S18 acetylase RimI-like enzyme